MTGFKNFVFSEFVLFPRNEPGVSSRGLISISDPISEDAIYKAVSLILSPSRINTRIT